MVVSLDHLLTLSIILFMIGAVGVMVRRHAIIAFMCIELMFNSINIAFVAFARAWNLIDGTISVFFIMVVAATEAAIGLAIVIAFFRGHGSIKTDEAADLKG